MHDLDKGTMNYILRWQILFGTLVSSISFQLHSRVKDWVIKHVSVLIASNDKVQSKDC